jgi:hypothetical protein
MNFLRISFLVTLSLFSLRSLGDGRETKLAVYTKSSSDTNKVILVGLDNPKFAPFAIPEFAPVGETNQEKGFEPKYLISINEKGPQFVYAFELGPKGSSDLPKALINIPKIKGNKFKDYVLPVLINDPAVLVFRHIFLKNSFRRLKVGSYLLHMLETSLKELKLEPSQRQFSALIEALDGDSQIPASTMGVAAALAHKYHPNGLISGPFARKGNLIDDYSAYLNKTFQKVSDQFLKLQVIAAKNNLFVRPLSPFYALVEYNCKTPPSLKLRDGLSLEMTATKNLQSYEKELCVDGSNNIPLVIVALNPTKSFFIPLINFRDTNSEKTKELLLIVKNLSIEAATNIIPFIPSIILSAGDMLVSLAVNKTGTTVYRVDRSALYPQLRMEGDFNLLDLDALGVEDQVFKIHIDQMKKLDPSEKEGLLQALDSSNHEIRGEAMNETVSLMAYDQSGVRFFNSGDQKYFETKEVEAWNLFIKNSDKILQALP